LPSFTHPHVVSNLYEFLSSAEDKIFWRMSVTKQLKYPICFHRRKKKYCGSQWGCNSECGGSL